MIIIINCLPLVWDWLMRMEDNAWSLKLNTCDLCEPLTEFMLTLDNAQEDLKVKFISEVYTYFAAKLKQMFQVFSKLTITCY